MTCAWEVVQHKFVEAAMLLKVLGFLLDVQPSEFSDFFIERIEAALDRATHERLDRRHEYRDGVRCKRKLGNQRSPTSIEVGRIFELEPATLHRYLSAKCP